MDFLFNTTFFFFPYYILLWVSLSSVNLILQYCKHLVLLWLLQHHRSLSESCTIECLGPSSSIESFGIVFFNSIPKIVIWKPFFTYFLSSKRVYKRSVKSLSNLGYNNNNNQALIPNFLGSAMDLQQNSHG